MSNMETSAPSLLFSTTKWIAILSVWLLYISFVGANIGVETNNSSVITEQTEHNIFNENTDLPDYEKVLDVKEEMDSNNIEEATKYSNAPGSIYSKDWQNNTHSNSFEMEEETNAEGDLEYIGRRGKQVNIESNSINTGGTKGKHKTKTTDEPFVNPSLKRHHDIWMKRIRQSDYVVYGGNEAMYAEEDGAKEQGNGAKGKGKSVKEDISSSTNNRLRAITEIIKPGKKIMGPQPNKVSNRCQCGTYNQRPRLRIVEGAETHAHRYPWMVSVQESRNKRHFCGASIISSTFLLTAAHCTDGMFPQELLVRLGDHDLTANDVSREKSYEVKEIIQHPGYNSVTTDSDIALLELYEEIGFTWRVNPICLTPSDLTYYGEIVTVMGWGREREKAKEGAPRLKHVNLRVLPMQKCRHNFKLKSEEVTSKMLCADGGTKDSCQGDSGGPLTWLDKANDRYFLVGLTSWGVGCGLPNYPGVYTKVTKFLTWIFEETQSSTFCAAKNPRPQRKKVKKKHLNAAGLRGVNGLGAKKKRKKDKRKKTFKGGILNKLSGKNRSPKAGFGTSGSAKKKFGKSGSVKANPGKSKNNMPRSGKSITTETKSEKSRNKMAKSGKSVRPKTRSGKFQNIKIEPTKPRKTKSKSRKQLKGKKSSKQKNGRRRKVKRQKNSMKYRKRRLNSGTKRNSLIKKKKKKKTQDNEVETNNLSEDK